MRLPGLLAMATVCVALWFAPSVSNAQDAFRPDELLVKFKQGVTRAEIDFVISSNGAVVVEYSEKLRVFRLKLPSGVSVSDMVAVFSADPRCEYAEPNYVGEAGDIPPNDTFYLEQWHLDNRGRTGGTVDADIDALEAWELTTGSSSITVAVLDSGIDSNHIEFRGRIVPGFDFVNNDSDPEADHPHGDSVTGIVAANADNGFSVAGVDHHVSILPVKVLDSHNFGSTSDLVDGLIFAADQGADVINMSLINYPSSSGALNDALQYARDRGAILIACAGNGGLGNADVSGPGASALTISVGATDHRDSRASFSGTGTALDVVAPGVSIPTAVHDEELDTYQLFSGCSAATPVVSGIATLLLARNPLLKHDHVRNILIQSAEDLVGPASEDSPGRDDFFGHGRVNLNEALRLAETGPESRIDKPSSDTSVVVGRAIDLQGSCTDVIGSSGFEHRWTFGAGSGIQDLLVEDPGAVVFRAPGIATVTFSCTDEFGRVDPSPARRVITVTNDAPNGEIVQPAADLTVVLGAGVDFRGSATDPDGHLPLSYQWDFDGAAPDSNQQNPGLVSFDTLGTFTVTLGVADNLGKVDATPATRTIIVINEPPDGVIESPAGNVGITQGGSIEFRATGNDPDGHLPLRFAWSFDGAAPPSAAEDPGLVTFEDVGTFIVTLSTTDGRGAEDPSRDTRTITVTNSPPEGRIDSPATNVSLVQGESVDFSASGQDPDGHVPLGYRWSFGGAAPDSTVEDPGRIMFRDVGTYAVTLTVTDSRGRMASPPATRTVTVNAPAAQGGGGGGGGGGGSLGWLTVALLLGIHLAARRRCQPRPAVSAMH